jgi:hypothetical protein
MKSGQPGSKRKEKGQKQEKREKEKRDKRKVWLVLVCDLSPSNALHELLLTVLTSTT